MSQASIYALVRELQGVMPTAQARLHAQRASMASSQGEHERAARAMLALAPLAAQQSVSTQAWRAWMLATLMEAARADARDCVADACEGYGWMAWSGQNQAALPWGLGPLLSLMEALRRDELAAQLGQWLTRAYPTSPYGPYISAHFRELERLAAGELSGPIAQANAQRFARAATLASATGCHKLAAHCALREGVARMLGAEDPSRGRALLKAIDAQALSPRERLWYVWGMSRSDFWLDRVRAIDALDGLLSACVQARPEAIGLDLDQLLTLTRQILMSQEVALQPAEQDRLEGLLTILPGHEGDALRQVMALRLALQDGLALPLSQSHSVEDALNTHAHVSGDPTWRRAASSLRFLRQVHTGSVEGALPREANDPSLRVAHSALMISDSALSRAWGPLAEALSRAHALLSSREAAPQAAQLNALASALPALFEALAASRADDTLEQERRDQLLELSQALLVRWAARAPKPSDGWWLLAAHALDAKLHEAGAALAKRALTSRDVEVDARLRDHVMEKLVAWAVAGEEQLTTLYWLEQAEQLAQG